MDELKWLKAVRDEMNYVSLCEVGIVYLVVMRVHSHVKNRI